MRKMTILLLLSMQLFALDMADVSIMRESGVRIAYPSERNAHAISRSTKPRDLLRVTYLKLNNQDLYSMPEWLPKMTNIVRLELRNTHLSLSEFEKLKTLHKLNSLDISDNRLYFKRGQLEKFLSSFNLSELYMANTKGNGHNYANIGNNTSLIKLDLSNNEISKLEPLKLQNLSKLKILYLNNNQLDDTLHTDKLPKDSLEMLDLSSNNLKRFTFSKDFTSLLKLNISNNRQYMTFDENYNNIFLFKNLKQGKFNKDFDLPKSIMQRLKIKYRWTSPNKYQCKSHDGRMVFDNVCQASKNNAERICYEMGGRLGTKYSIVRTIRNCTGEIANDFGTREYRNNTMKSNTNNSVYQECYNRLGFNAMSYYWTSTYVDENNQRAWMLDLRNGYMTGADTKLQYNVMCILVDTR